MMCRFSTAIPAGLLLVPAAGCATTNEDLRHFLDANTTHVSAIEYRVDIPDAIEITAPRILEIDGRGGRIQPDGKISLPLIGDVKVVGMTAKEIGLKLTALLRPYYNDPKVQVRVAGYNSKKFYVFGMVGGTGQAGSGGGAGLVSDVSGGSRVYTGRDTLLDALAETGMNFIAWRSRVQIIKANPDPERRKRIVVNVDKMIREGDLTENVLLEPNDIVYVPPTPIGWLGLRLQEILFPFSPVISAYQFPAGVINASDVYRNPNRNDN